MKGLIGDLSQEDRRLFRTLFETNKREMVQAAVRGQVPVDAEELEEDVYNYGDFLQHDDHPYEDDDQRFRLYTPLTIAFNRWLEEGGLKKGVAEARAARKAPKAGRPMTAAELRRRMR